MGDIFLHNLKPDPGAHAQQEARGPRRGFRPGQDLRPWHERLEAAVGRPDSPRYEGGQMPLHMRLPKLRGPLAKTAMPIGPFRTYMTPVNLSRLAVFAAGEVVSPEALVEKGIIKKADERVKILATGELTQPLTIKAHGFSACGLGQDRGRRRHGGSDLASC